MTLGLGEPHLVVLGFAGCWDLDDLTVSPQGENQTMFQDFSRGCLICPFSFVVTSEDLLISSPQGKRTSSAKQLCGQLDDWLKTGGPRLTTEDEQNRLLGRSTFVGRQPTVFTDIWIFLCLLAFSLLVGTPGFFDHRSSEPCSARDSKSAPLF